MSKDELRRQQVDDYRNSGLSAEIWCEANTMKVSTLRYWYAGQGTAKILSV